MPDPITPISDDDLADFRAWVEHEASRGGAGDRIPASHVLPVLARLKDAEARLAIETDTTTRIYVKEWLASPEGVVTLDGKQWRVEGQRWSVTMGEDGVWDGEGMPPGTYVCLVPYQPEDPKHG